MNLVFNTFVYSNMGLSEMQQPDNWSGFEASQFAEIKFTNEWGSVDELLIALSRAIFGINYAPIPSMPPAQHSYVERTFRFALPRQGRGDRGRNMVFASGMTTSKHHISAISPPVYFTGDPLLRQGSGVGVGKTYPMMSLDIALSDWQSPRNIINVKKISIRVLFAVH
jgi:hypothetical protein